MCKPTRAAAVGKLHANCPLRLMLHGVVTVVLCDVVHRCVKGMQLKGMGCAELTADAVAASVTQAIASA